MKPRDQFIAHFHHEFAGIILDAVTTTKNGSELSILLKGLIARVELRLGQAYDYLHPRVEPSPLNWSRIYQGQVLASNGAKKP